MKLANGVHKVTSPSFVFTVTNTTRHRRQAHCARQLLDANDRRRFDQRFNIPGAGVQLSVLLLPCQPLHPTTGDNRRLHATGSSQNTNPPGQRDNARILIELSGAMAPPISGLNINANGCGVRGLIINRFQLNAINIGSFCLL